MKTMNVRSWALVGAVTATVAAPAYAADACGGIELADGAVKTGKPLTGAPAEDACVKDVAAFLAKNEDVRGVTVEMRTKDEDRVGGKALGTAKRVAGVLTAAGVKNVSPIVPRSDGLTLGLVLSVQLRPPPAPVAMVAEKSGELTFGAEGAMKPAHMGTHLSAGNVVATTEGGGTVMFPEAALVNVRGSSKVRVVADGQLALEQGRVRVTTTNKAKVVEVKVGAATIAVGPSSLAEIEATGANGFTVANQAGQVELRATGGTQQIAAGQGTASKGGAPDKARALLAAPVVTATGQGGNVRWQPVAGAGGYRVEVSKGADFGADTKTFPAAATETSISSAEGKTFFRVSAIDGNGVPGNPSKVYSVTP